jgi:uncharacterized protein (DUF58 family)
VSALPFEFNGVVRFTRIGAAYLVFTLLVGFAALNTGNNSLYIGLSFMLGALLFSGIASKGALRRIDVTIEQIGEAWAGQRTRCTLRVANRSPLWNVRDLIISSPFMSRPLLLAELGRRQERTVSADLLFTRRGVATLDRVDLYTRYPFGIFLKKRRLTVSGEAVVYPQLLERSDTTTMLAALLGNATPMERSGPGTELFALREYNRGDSLRHLHWKKSASVGRWIMKQHQSDAGRSLAVVVDPVVPVHVGDEEFERLISEAATLIDIALEEDYEVHLYAGAIVVTSTPSTGGRELFEVLALLEPSREKVYLSVPRGAVIFSLQQEGSSDA